MKHTIPASVFVVALLVGQLSCNAQNPAPQPQVFPAQPAQPPAFQTSQNAVQPAQPQAFQTSQNAVQPAQPQAFQTSQNAVQPGQYPAPGSGPSLVPSKNSLRKFSPVHTGDAQMPEGAFNGYSQIRTSPDLGAPGSAGNGFHHFPMPFDKYTTWYRPKAATLTQHQRCEPASFRPRGFGNLFARPGDGFRMEYEPYSVGDDNSKYGPAYMSRMPDPRCDDHCKHCGHGPDECHCR